MALACAAVLLAAPADARDARHDGLRGSVLRDRRLYPLGALHAASFGLSVIAGNWVVTLLERQGHGHAAAGLAGSLILLAGIVTRPAGGLLARRAPGRARTFVGLTLVASAAGVGVVNGLAVLTIVVGTPLAGLAFEFPSDGRLAFAGIGALSLAALAALARARTL